MSKPVSINEQVDGDSTEMQHMNYSSNDRMARHSILVAWPLLMCLVATLACGDEQGFELADDDFATSSQSLIGWDPATYCGEIYQHKNYDGKQFGMHMTTTRVSLGRINKRGTSMITAPGCTVRLYKDRNKIFERTGPHYKPKFPPTPMTALHTILVLATSRTPIRSPSCMSIVTPTEAMAHEPSYRYGMKAPSTLQHRPAVTGITESTPLSFRRAEASTPAPPSSPPSTLRLHRPE